eukprot:5098567-Pleurochrysis_carterae.AAC.2
MARALSAANVLACASKHAQSGAERVRGLRCTSLGCAFCAGQWAAARPCRTISARATHSL